MALKAVIFDYGDTLVSTRMNWDRVKPEQMLSLGHALGQDFPHLDLLRLGRDFLFLRSQARLLALRSHIETPAVESLATALALQGQHGLDGDLLQKGVDAFFEPEEANYSVIVGIPEALQSLKEMGLRLAVLSNATCGKLVRRALDNHSLLKMFDQVMVSCELSRRKPAPEAFEAVLESLQVQPSESLMVGDLLRTDIAGANLVGMKSILVDFFGDGTETNGGPPLPDAVVGYPQNLVKVIKSWL